MSNNKKVFISIYCKVYAENFSEEMIDRLTTGDEVFKFLMNDAGLCYDESDRPILGDSTIWYLGCNEKTGHLQVDDTIWKWGYGESSFDIVEDFVSTLYEKNIISDIQYQDLIANINVGRQIDDMYEIPNYLICKRDGITWVKRSDASEFRSNIKQIVSDVEVSFQNRGYRCILPDKSDSRDS